MPSFSVLETTGLKGPVPVRARDSQKNNWVVLKSINTCLASSLVSLNQSQLALANTSSPAPPTTTIFVLTSFLYPIRSRDGVGINGVGRVSPSISQGWCGAGERASPAKRSPSLSEPCALLGAGCGSTQLDLCSAHALLPRLTRAWGEGKAWQTTGAVLGTAVINRVNTEGIGTT